MPIRAIIIDLGGVILRTCDWEPRRLLATKLGTDSEQLYRLIFDSPSALQATLGQIPSHEHWEIVRQALQCTQQEFAGAPDEFFNGDEIDTELVDSLRSWHKTYKIGLLSNAWDNLRSLITDVWKFADVFDEMIISAEVGMKKPDPVIYALAAQRLGVAPQEAVFVDDFQVNIEAAVLAGMRAVHFRDPQQARAELEQILNGKL